MIHITNKQDCCGCSACVQRCPKHCIHLTEDAEGFLYPIIDKKICINCGICENVCPLLHPSKPIPVLKTLAVKNVHEEERFSSSSGGVFISIAKTILQKGGVVFGAVYDEHWEVKHTYAETKKNVKAMMGSKYLQSRIENSYIETERFLKSGREVLFTGTPCQIAGLRKFLRKNYPNLLTVDFLCHGVPSPGVWRKYLYETFSNLHTNSSSSQNIIPAITSISFREKTHGWKNFSIEFRGNSIPQTGRNITLLSDIHRENPFMRGFLSDIYLRPSCYNCRCKNGVSQSDLTIADYWGIDKLMPDFDDDKGIGLVLINTSKGESYFNLLNMEVRLSTLKDAQQFNGGFKERIRIHPKRDFFFKQLSEGKSVSKTVELCLHISIYRKIYSKLKKLSNNLKHL
ncbi:Coenzyme F420 hydrogenase/dehydrogenase, beta subunit C-terminal domain [Phocaeicola barnesiae]|uniref:Coenzyme F420 hydrogenase/dehydrogenase, beta subunit C-terminal domain n=1 Tax=Phocaeicola barnesiae TaxID=376804 RepID=UPI0025A3D433|nr:Coenzyme F420 hydrogenase/dehydrogenase, beta subunit C-terminal domain [Phocaeicola barnesiae]MDM8234239.1 Coenzyme F420 hydrogenase/dehydrogenase, beta subunit C-terminal domain [Phocaeicola barnesiae]